MSADPPPSYAQSTGSSAVESRPRTRNGIPSQRRRSMEDEARPLPHGWVRQYDPKNQHQFFVDTNAKPPRSIWHHPHDDEQYLSTLTTEERERLEEQKNNPSRADIISMSSTEDLHQSFGGNNKAGASSSAAPKNDTSHLSPTQQPKGFKKFGRSLKDKMTGTTHEQREVERRERDLQEQREYEMHQRVRQAMARAMETGQPQLIGKDRNGKEVFVEPPAYGPSPGYYGGRGYGVSPYQSGPYHHNPNAVYYRPDYAYNRPYGYGYGGGMGLPIMGGLLGGAVLGGLLF